MITAPVIKSFVIIMTVQGIDVKVNDSAYEKEIIRILSSGFGIDENIIKVTKGDNNGAF